MYGGNGQWTVDKSWPEADIARIVEFTQAPDAERELINNGGAWSGEVQGPF